MHYILMNHVTPRFMYCTRFTYNTVVDVTLNVYRAYMTLSPMPDIVLTHFTVASDTTLNTL